MRPSDSIAGRAAGPRFTLIVACAISGCGVGNISSDTASPREKFTANAWPALARCLGCHGAEPTIDFLAPGTVDAAYATVFGFQPPVLDLASPAASLLVTMGEHTGPALTAEESAVLLDWLGAERAARQHADMPVVVGPVALQLGATATIDLGGGATLQLHADSVAGGLAMSGLALHAGAGGLHVVHPLFVSQPKAAKPIVDEVDRFGDLDARLGAGEILTLGEELFLTFIPTDPVTIHFKILEAP